MDTQKEIKCPDCDGTGARLEMTMTQGCCHRPNDDGSCCGVGEPNWEPEQVQCSKCKATGMIKNPNLTDTKAKEKQL